jgi:hypothetical protein
MLLPLRARNARAHSPATQQPNFYNSKRNLTAAEYARCCLATEWAAFAQRLSCPCSSAACCVGAMFAGPVYGHLNVFPSTIKFFLE